LDDHATTCTTGVSFGWGTVYIARRSATLCNVALQSQVSENVRVLAAARGTTPTAAARSVGMSAERLHAKLQGRVRWNVEDLELLAPALGVEPASLIAGGFELRAVRHQGLEPRTRWLGVWRIFALISALVRFGRTPPRLGVRVPSREGWVLGA
jgi:Cro/C1-type HTH DNA-binding domain